MRRLDPAMTKGGEGDLTERTLEALRRSDHNFRTIIERSPLPTCVSTTTQLLYVNPAMIEYLGYDDQGAMIGPTLTELSDELIHPDDRQRTREAFARLFASLDHGEPSRESVRIDEVRVRTRRGGTTRYCDMHGVAILHDRAPALVTYLHDHTERRTAAEYVRLGDRMSALGTLAAGVAHEINNPLTYVITNIDLVATRAATLDGTVRDELSELISDARTGLERIHHIVKALRTFSRGDGETITPVDLTQVLDSSIDMASSHLRHRARLVRRYQPVMPARGNVTRLGQVFVNLLLNAAQALSESDLERNEVVVSVEPAGDRVLVSVSDNGVGIPAGDLPRVFDAFFTTKPIGVGTGLGLFVCHGIVTALGGTIGIESERSKGTTVRIALPIADPPPAPVVSEPRPARSARRGRVLVIDDEPLVLGAVCRLLDDEHEVTAFTSGQQALDRLLAGDRFDLLLCDLMMPEMRGDELFSILEARFPEIAARMVFMTGGAVTDLASAFAAERPNAVIEKPFDASALVAFVRERVGLR
jgi:PAS domain S-box-containing protein